ncbi:MAG: NAD(P)H-dependent oxidoreductase [Bdellovibrionales bacterium]|nr:NAD(P)H-dependent oxidoreductase [Bdellovibrionales bacterium]
MKYLLFSGSFRTESLNKKLISEVDKILSKESSNQIVTADLRSLSIPVYDGDIESKGIPDGVSQLGEMIKSAEAIIIASPEYNGSIAGPLKNTIDWVSRLRPVPFEGKPILLMGASPGGFGAIRSLSFTKVPLESLGCYIFPQTFALPKAHEAFSENGQLIEGPLKTKLSEVLKKFKMFAERF